MISKVVFFCLAVAAVNAGILPVNFGYAPALKVVAPVYHAASYAPKVVEKPQPYDFNYEIQTDDAGSLWQRESGDDYGNKQGSFGYRDANGVYRQVEYVADEAGFRPVIKTNEPGTANANPADVQIAAEESPIKYQVPVKAYRPHKIVKVHAPALYAAHVPLYHQPAIHAVVHAAPYGYNH
ncbi:cuticle protein 10.9-like [Limulus polyphemus]|uniref:Cuticle protein 10.9-like n=1 Tax=Limulus polyphemus TaxID=6850 RepID=A0ABM1B237_LIMPO|nr:cuticle protein 10.9-like [Limulus polyphemus]